MVTIIIAAVSNWSQYRLVTSTDHSLQDELRVLREISGQIKILNDRLSSEIKTKSATVMASGKRAGPKASIKTAVSTQPD